MALPSAWALSSAMEVPGKDFENTKQAVEFSLKKIDADFTSTQRQTAGFGIKYTSKWYSPYSYDLYIGSFDDSGSIVRVESSFMWFQGSMSHALNDVIAQTNEIDTFEKSYPKKNIFLANALTILSPGFGYLYMNTNSPFGKEMSFLRTFIMLSADVFLLWMGSKTFFTHGFDPFDRGLVSMLAVGSAYRVMVLPGINFQVIAQNRLISLGYKFRY